MDRQDGRLSYMPGTAELSLISRTTSLMNRRIASLMVRTFLVVVLALGLALVPAGARRVVAATYPCGRDFSHFAETYENTDGTDANKGVFAAYHGPFTARAGLSTGPLTIAQTNKLPSIGTTINIIFQVLSLDPYIDWGDGTCDSGQQVLRLFSQIVGFGKCPLTSPLDTCEIVGTHTYATAGTYTINAGYAFNSVVAGTFHENYHTSITVRADQNQPDWMGNMAGQIGNLPLDHLVLPGSHDSATAALSRSSPIINATDPNHATSYQILNGAVTALRDLPAQAAAWINGQSGFVQALLPPAADVQTLLTDVVSAIIPSVARELPAFIAGFARTQSLTLRQQLDLGIRSFDLRIHDTPSSGSLSADSFVFHHGGSVSYKVIPELQSMAQWATLHPTELAILLAGDYAWYPGEDPGTQTTQVCNIANAIHATFGSELIPNTFSTTSTYNQLIRAGQFIVEFPASVDVTSVRPLPDSCSGVLDSSGNVVAPWLWTHVPGVGGYANAIQWTKLESFVMSALQCDCDPTSSGKTTAKSIDGLFTLSLQATEGTDLGFYLNSLPSLVEKYGGDQDVQNILCTLKTLAYNLNLGLLSAALFGGTNGQCDDNAQYAQNLFTRLGIVLAPAIAGTSFDNQNSDWIWGATLEEVAAQTNPRILNDLQTQLSNDPSLLNNLNIVSSDFVGSDLVDFAMKQNRALANGTLTVSVPSASGDYHDSDPVSATVTDHSGNPIQGASVTFTLNSAEHCTATTNATGTASCSVTPQEQSGTYTITADATPPSTDTTHLPSNGSGSFTVTPEETSTTYDGATSVQQGDSLTLAASLTEDGTVPISGRTVTLALDSLGCAGTSDTLGSATCTVIVPGDFPLGYHQATASFVGDNFYKPSNGSGQVLVYTTTSLRYNGAATGEFNDPATLSAVLVDHAGNAVSGEPVSFTLNGAETCSGTTDATGTASCTVTPGEAAGTYSVAVTFGGDLTHRSSSTSSTFTVTQDEAKLTSATSLQPFILGQPANLSAVLTDPEGGAPIAGKPVVLTLGSGAAAQSCTGTTDTTGTASCTITSVTVPLGPQPVTDSFAGDSYYQAATNNQQAIVFSYPASGAFVLGDQTAASALGTGATVTWWGAQWAKLNSLSGGAAPSSFKGFAPVLSSMPPAIGGSWSSGPGNSATPPSSVPSYMGVLISSTAGQSGSAISGNISHIAVVKTNPGYGPDPGQAGTGTVVAEF